MAHGKETPRQKMIGMMYLVLMAMLALNVSKEVLDTFDVLDDGLKKTIETLDQTNAKVLSDFAAQYELNKSKVGPWQEKALKVKEDADKIVEFIQDKKIEILKFSKDLEAFDEQSKNVNARDIKSKDNTEAPANIMVGDNNDRAGRDLRLMMEDYRNYLVTQVVASESAGPIRKSIESALNTSSEPMREKHGGDKVDTETHSWESEHFENLPLSGVLTIMTGLQINVRNAESEALKYLYAQISAGDVNFNKISATVIPNSNYIIKGNEYRAEVFLAASDTTADPKIFVTTDPNPYDSVKVGESYEYKRREGLNYQELDVPKGSGMGVFKMPGTALGMKNWGGIIELTGPSGTIIKPFKKKFLVAEGAVTVAPTKMNVFYLGVDNPVDVSVAGVQPDKIDISVTNARHEKRGGSYIIKPIRPGNAFVVVYATIDGERREMGRKEFRVKTVPNPVAMVNNQKGGAINQNILAAQLGVVAEMENFDFDLKFTITEFTVSAVVQGFVREFTAKSNRFTPEQQNLIKSLSRGNNVYIQDIKAVGPDGSTRPLSTINFKLN
jgi:gliding motility-associated protein GldM